MFLQSSKNNIQFLFDLKENLSTFYEVSMYHVWKNKKNAKDDSNLHSKLICGLIAPDTNIYKLYISNIKLSSKNVEFLNFFCGNLSGKKNFIFNKYKIAQQYLGYRRWGVRKRVKNDSKALNNNYCLLINVIIITIGKGFNCIVN